MIILKPLYLADRQAYVALDYSIIFLGNQLAGFLSHGYHSHLSIKWFRLFFQLNARNHAIDALKLVFWGVKLNRKPF